MAAVSRLLPPVHKNCGRTVRNHVDGTLARGLRGRGRQLPKD